MSYALILLCLVSWSVPGSSTVQVMHLSSAATFDPTSIFVAIDQPLTSLECPSTKAPIPVYTKSEVVEGEKLHLEVLLECLSFYPANTCTSTMGAVDPFLNINVVEYNISEYAVVDPTKVPVKRSNETLPNDIESNNDTATSVQQELGIEIHQNLSANLEVVLNKHLPQTYTIFVPTICKGFLQTIGEVESRLGEDTLQLTNISLYTWHKEVSLTIQCIMDCSLSTNGSAEMPTLTLEGDSPSINQQLKLVTVHATSPPSQELKPQLLVTLRSREGEVILTKIYFVVFAIVQEDSKLLGTVITVVVIVLGAFLLIAWMNAGMNLFLAGRAKAQEQEFTNVIPSTPGDSPKGSIVEDPEESMPVRSSASLHLENPQLYGESRRVEIPTGVSPSVPVRSSARLYLDSPRMSKRSHTSPLVGYGSSTTPNTREPFERTTLQTLEQTYPHRGVHDDVLDVDKPWIGGGGDGDEDMVSGDPLHGTTSPVTPNE